MVTATDGDYDATDVDSARVDVMWAARSFAHADALARELGFRPQSPGIHGLPRALFDRIPAKEDRIDGTDGPFWTKDIQRVSFYCHEPPQATVKDPVGAILEAAP